ncbi:HlyD family type I secretion periplasmic adaptor subunit [Providencia rettgeri]|uniref:HlyD family type I secretion periplasmic adaptor subunit n=1 Tax=Providencia rettgeri TaxID=587 RepID=UPI001EFCF775|nr:HlyD family type I secretion periplasmic adaptor subunit [Providencia rettgeri]MCG9528461.1 HlyD family type I secretion periplasmic adaptor subunit [Providencia rettgeri]
MGQIIYRFFPLVLLVGIILSFCLPLDITVHARGYLEVKNRNVIIEHANGGRIEKLYVREGDKVQKGQLLAVIDNSYVTEDYNKNQVSLQSLRMKELRLLAEINQAPFILPENGDMELFNQELAVFTNRQTSLQKSLQISKTAEAQKVSELAQLETQLSGLQKEKNIAQKQVDIVKSLVSSGAVSSSNFLSAQNDLQKIENTLRNVDAQQKTLRIEIEQAKLNISKIHDDFKTKSQEELLQVQDNINEALARENTITTRKNQDQIFSPVNGSIQSLAKTNPGSVIASGGEILTILPDDVPVVVVVKVKPEDRDKLWDGMKSRIKVNSFGNSQNETLFGEVEVISSDSIEDREGRYYKVQIAVSNPTEEDKLYPGMSVDAYLNVGQRSVFQYLFKPLVNGFSTALSEP